MTFGLFVYVCACSRVVVRVCVEVKGQPQTSFFRGTIRLIWGNEISHWGLRVANKRRCPPASACLALELQTHVTIPGIALCAVSAAEPQVPIITQQVLSQLSRLPSPDRVSCVC